ncbi:MAG: DUF2970 domain-containing protein [Panacagrimonas sp.]
MNQTDADRPVQGLHPSRVGLLTTMGSVLWAFFGVQSSRARVRDFSQGSPALFFGVAFALTAGFAVILIGIVRLIMHSAGVPG